MYGNFKFKKVNKISYASKDEEKDKKGNKQDIGCFKGKKLEHVKYEYPVLVKKMKKYKKSSKFLMTT